MDPRAMVAAALIVGLARIACATEPLMPRELPGVSGGAGTVGVTDFAGGLGFLDDLEAVAAVIERIRVRELIPDVVVSRQYALADVADPWTSSAGGPVLAGVPLPFPSDTDANDDDFISMAKGTLWVPESGTYTIQVRSNEGMGLRMIGAPFRSVHGRGALDRDGSMIVSSRTDDADTRGIIELSAGPHAFEFLTWERDRGAYWEITSAVGAHPETATTRWLALGDSTTLPPLGGARRLATLVGPARVINVSEADGGAATDITAARERVLQALADHEGIVRDDVTTIVLDDHDGPPNPWRPGYWVRGAGASYRWPLNDPAVGGDATRDFDYFSSGLFGKLQVNDGDGIPAEDLLLTFALFSSDGSQFHIAGRSFLWGNETADLSYRIGGDTTLSHPGSTLTADAFGLITLQEGIIYDWEGSHYENRADAGYEIWAAEGDQLGIKPDDSEQFLAKFFPLSSTLQELVVPGNQGLTFVDVDPGLTGDHNADGVLGAEDLELQSVAIDAGMHPAAYDLNGDALVDYADRQFWVAQLKGSYIGDANLDGQFNSADFVLVFAAGRYETTADATWSQGDWNGDRFFDSADFVAAFADGGYEAGPRLRSTPVVPEPDISLLTLVGMAAVGIRWRGAGRSSGRAAQDS